MDLSEDELIKARGPPALGSRAGRRGRAGRRRRGRRARAPASSCSPTDLLAEGVHFERGAISARDLGAKAITVNVSDVAAMAASPATRSSRSRSGRDVDAAWVMELVGGMRDACASTRSRLVGGDTNRADLVVVSVAVVGEVAPGRAVLRVGRPRPATGSS